MPFRLWHSPRRQESVSNFRISLSSPVAAAHSEILKWSLRVADGGCDPPKSATFGLRPAAKTRTLTRNPKRSPLLPFLSGVLAILVLAPACVVSRGQRYRHFVTKTPLPANHYLILGFMGGREPWDNDKRGVRKLALKLRAMHRTDVHVETVENTKRHLAIELIRKAFDRNQDGRLDERERASTRLILYGQSFGGAAVVKLARQLKPMDVPVLLTVQIDSVGIGDAVIPSNVAEAANLFQRNGIFIRGEPGIRPEDAQRTRILGNFKFDYRDKKIDLSEVSWAKKFFRTAHTKMDFDPEVWAKVEELILNAIE